MLSLDIHLGQNSDNNQISYDDPTLTYELLRLIGKGSFGQVFLAKDLNSNELVSFYYRFKIIVFRLILRLLLKQ
jgi:serine/threonine protein kinase